MLKITVREFDKITTVIKPNDIAFDFFSNFSNLFDNDIDYFLQKDHFENNIQFNNNHIIHKQKNTKSPFKCGYLFIDRVNKKIFNIQEVHFLNFYNFDFNKEEHKKYEKNNYIIFTSNYYKDNIEKIKKNKKDNHIIKKNKKGFYIDILKTPNNNGFYRRNEHLRLNSALPYLIEIKYDNDKIYNISNFYEIIDLLKHNRRKRGKINGFLKPEMELSRFKKWIFFESTSDYKILYDYLNEEKLLNKKDNYYWEVFLQKK